MSQYEQFYTMQEAADLYGMAKSTIWSATKLTDGKGLSTEKQTRGAQEVSVISIGELMRVYGDPEQTKRNKTKPKKQTQTKENKGFEADFSQIALLQTELENARKLLEKEQEERARERKQNQTEVERALEQAKQAVKQAEGWQSQAEQQTRLLTDERDKTDKVKEQLEQEREKATRSRWKFWQR